MKVYKSTLSVFAYPQCVRLLFGSLPVSISPEKIVVCSEVRPQSVSEDIVLP
jgi:hypothetical protein